MTAKLCWWCSHDLPGGAKNIAAPTRVKPDGDMETEGAFCSWPCAKAYITDRGECADLLTMMRKRADGEATHTACAPSWKRLQAFGGDMTIEEFRASSEGAQRAPIIPSMTPGSYKRASRGAIGAGPPGGLRIKRPRKGGASSSGDIAAKLGMC